MIKVIGQTLMGLLFMAVGFVVVLADVHVAFKADGSAHVINQIIGVGMIAVGGLVINPTRTLSVLKNLTGVADPYIPHRRFDDPPGPGVPPGGPTGGVQG